MNRDEIDKLLTGENDEVLEAHTEIVSIQKDKSNLIKFGQEWLDNSLPAGLNNKMIFLGSRPGNGKTWHCSQTIKNLLNKEINPSPIKVLRCNLEIPTAVLLLGEIAKTLKKRPSEILSSEYLEDEKPIVTKVVAEFRDKRVKNVSTALKGDDYRYFLQKFIDEVDNEDKIASEGLEKPIKTKKVVLTDHIHVYLTKDVIDNLLSIQNEMKMKDKNLSFINYFQLNRETEEMWRSTKTTNVNPRNMLPNAGSIYATDFLQMFSDLTVAMVIPQIYELDEYAAVNKERNAHLSEHFTEDNPDNSFVRLKGRNRIYYNFIKIRLLDSFEDPRIFCDILNPDYEKTAEKIAAENKQPFVKSIKNIPVFKAEILEKQELPEPNFSMEAAFEIPKKEETPDSPF